MRFDEHLDQIITRKQFLEAAIAEGQSGHRDMAALGREYSEIRPVADLIADYQRAVIELGEARALLDDPEMAALADEEAEALQTQVQKARQALQLALLPRDVADERPAIIEIRPGTGGEEAALFAADLLRMYLRYSDRRGWAVDVIDEQATELGGIRQAVARFSGNSVFARMKFESGVHRVQRVPVTEAGGRVHTSAATVAVLPEAEAVEVVINPADLRIETMRSSGAGGQHVNTTDSAVRITHLPSGIVVTSSQKSQHRNRDIAMEVLRARLFERKRMQQASDRASRRAGQIGSGDRSERVRTYNFPDGRVTDHRIKLTLHRIEQIMAGDLDELVDALAADAQARQLAAFSE